VSEENVERLLEATELFNRFADAPESGNPEDVLSFLRLMDPVINFEPQQALLQGTYIGHDGVVGWLADVAEHYENGHMDYADIRDLGERVLALGTLRVTGRGSGIEIEVPLAIMASFRDGLITHLKDYGEKDQALAAAGLAD
jgi:ketosteroid isomerase-like protein